MYYITPILTHIINRITLQGLCLYQFKISVIVPIHKNGEKCDINSYRPIALISNLAKVFKKVIHSRLLCFAMKYKRINIRQFGLLKNKGSGDAIAQLSKFVYENLS